MQHSDLKHTVSGNTYIYINNPQSGSEKKLNQILKKEKEIVPIFINMKSLMHRVMRVSLWLLHVFG